MKAKRAKAPRRLKLKSRRLKPAARGRLRGRLLGTIGPSLLLLAGAVFDLGCEQDNPPYPKQVIMIGFDGMDHKLCAAMIEQGRLPNLARLAEQGTFKRLGTSTPPQSPVAWSNLMTGTNPGEHGVFDFVHRDPATGMPFSSAAQTQEPRPLALIGSALDSVSVLGYRWPIRPNVIKTNRHAPAFWEYLTEAGVAVHVFRMPANYPPTPSAGAHFCCLSDMGTVDILNTLGTFSYYTQDPDERYTAMSKHGGRLYPIIMTDHRTEAMFHGPENTYLVASRGMNPASRRGGRRTYARVPFSIRRDPVQAVATIRFDDRDVVLNEGEWSGWQPIEFEMIPHVLALKGICRFYLKQVHPYLQLYVSPFNFDPREESWEIDQPSDWSVTVSGRVGRYYTQGLSEDTKALSNQVLSRDEFLAQTELVLQERLALFDLAMDHYRGGFLFFYFGSTDQIGHMFWGARRPGHPAVTPQEHEKYKGVMEDLYVRMDGVVEKVAARFPEATLIIMSDHGFCDYSRTFNLNTWLKENGYAKMENPLDSRRPVNFDFSETRAYAIGLNGLYVNLNGRENQGIVDPGDKQTLMDELAARLKAYRDPETGARVVKEVYQCDRVFSGPKLGVGPDLIVGYDAGYRGGGESALGGFPEKTVQDNDDAWCGDHCVATDVVPGVLFCNRKVGVDDPTLLDIAPTLLREFGVAPPSQMKGRYLFGAGETR